MAEPFFVDKRLNQVAVSNRADRLALVLITSLALAACGHASSSTSVTRQPLASHATDGGRPSRTSHECVPADLTLTTLPISPETGEHGLVLVFRDDAGPCVLKGTPSVRLRDRTGAMVPLVVRNTDSYVRAIPSRAVPLTAGRRAFVLVAKYRCDMGDAQVAAVADVHLDRTPGTLTADVRSVDLARCVGSRHGPGQTIAVSPFVANPQELAPKQPG